MQRALHSKFVVGGAIAVAVFAAVVGVRHMGLFQALELQVYDQLLRLRAARATLEAPITLVRVYEEDLKRHGSSLSDATLAQALQALSDLRPRVIGVDIFRDISSAGRDELARAVVDNPRIVLIHSLLGERVPPPDFIADSTQIGFADLKLDMDGAVRRGLAVLWDDKEPHQPSLSFGLMLTLKYLQEEDIARAEPQANDNTVWLGRTPLRRFGANDGGYVNADDGGYQFLLDYLHGTKPFPSVSISQILDGKLDPKLIENRIVILGTTSPTVKDSFETPFTGSWSGDAPTMYGIEVHAHTVDQLLRTALRGDVPIGALDEHWEVVWILVFSVVGVVAGIRVRAPWPLAVAGIAGCCLPLGSTYLAFFNDLWIPAASPVAAWLGALGCSVAYVSEQEHVERERMMELFGRFVSRDIASTLWEQRDEFMDGAAPRPQRLTVTVLMSDLKGYTAAAEKMDAADVMDWINGYISAMTTIVDRHGGIVEDFAGDGLKVNFGVPVPRDGARIAADARRAVDCALAMGDELRRINARWQERGLPTARLRIGVYTGPVIAGSLGGERRMTYKTVGDTVNIAERLESFDKPGFETELSSSFRILVGEFTYKHLGPQYRTRCIGAHSLRGRKNEITIYRVTGYAPDIDNLIQIAQFARPGSPND